VEPIRFLMNVCGMLFHSCIRARRSSSKVSGGFNRSHYGSKVPAVTVTVFKYRNKIGKIVVKALYMIFICIYHPSLWTFTCFGGAPCLIVYAPESHTLSNYRVRLVSEKKKKKKKKKWPIFFLTGNIIFVSIYIPLFYIQSTIKKWMVYTNKNHVQYIHRTAALSFICVVMKASGWNSTWP
jgi:hypothetical protein